MTGYVDPMGGVTMHQQTHTVFGTHSVHVDHRPKLNGLLRRAGR